MPKGLHLVNIYKYYKIKLNMYFALHNYVSYIITCGKVYSVIGKHCHGGTKCVCVGGDVGVATRIGGGVQVDSSQREERLCKPCKHLSYCMSNHTNCNVTILLMFM